MDIEARLSLSFYKNIATISDAHKIYVAQHIQTGKIYVRKVLDVYNKSVYEYLRSHHIPHTPRIYEVYEEESQLVVIEEYISGDTLEQLLEQGTSFSTEKVRDIIMQLCSIVKALHSAAPPIIHRDIKPSNIILSPSGEVFLLDFNAAKYHSARGDYKNEDTSLLGTKGYAAPEQYGFGVSTTQTDIYAIGMVLKDLAATISPAAGDYRSKFGVIIAKCTKLNPEERYKDVSSILHILYKNVPVEINEKKSLPAWTTYLPPGFRTFTPLYMLLALGMYAFTFWICLTLEVNESTPASLLFEKIMCFFMFLTIIFCTANYRNVQSLFPPCRVKNMFLRVCAVFLLDFLIFFAFMTIMIMIVALIKM